MNVSLVNSPDSTTMSKCTYLLVVLLFLACGGKTSLVDDIRVMQSTPIDLCLDSLQYYICCYSYQEASCYALARYLNGEFTATGVNPITQGL